MRNMIIISLGNKTMHNKKGMSGHPTNLGSNKRQDRRQVHREQSHFSDLIP